MHDFAIRNVRILDGTGAAAFEGDLGIDGRHIADVGSVGPASREFDGAGKVLAPGFVDTHTHDDAALLHYPNMWFKTNQGVTTVVLGNCGKSAVPCQTGDGTSKAMYLEPTWDDLAGYRAALETKPPAVNAVALMGHNTVREAVVGMEERPATPDELARMREIVRRGMEDGACGFSTGLIYAPGKWAPFEELVALAAEAAPFGGVYASHIRNEREKLLEAVAEAIAIGDEAGVGTHVSHHKAGQQEAPGMVATSLREIDAAIDAGKDVSLDVYPYTAGSGLLAQYFRDSMDLEYARLIGLARCPPFPEYEGRMLVDIAQTEDLGLDGLIRKILAAPLGDRTVCLTFVMHEDDVEENLRHPRVMIGSDGIPQLDGKPHPRLVGTFPRVLGRYVRERGVAPLEQVVRRMTSVPADRFGLVGRGRIALGHFADLVVFDPELIEDVATFEDPLQPCRGVQLVLVNGEPVWEEEVATSARPGRLLHYGRG